MYQLSCEVQSDCGILSGAHQSKSSKKQSIGFNTTVLLKSSTKVFVGAVSV
jgi:hypothetical protein